MYHKILISIVLFLFTTLNINAFELTYKIQQKQISKFGVTNISKIKTDFDPQVQNIEMPVPGSSSYRAFLMEVRQQIKTVEPTARLMKKEDDHDPVIEPPVIKSSFEGNLFNNRMPNDNDLAVSNDGYVVSVINSNINVFDPGGNVLEDISLYAFSDTLGINGNKYDPRVVYDPIANRFIVVFLNGNTDTNSMVILGFSQTSDPTGNWNLYALPGNPLNDTSWSDYPIIAVTENELIITLNLLTTGESWQEGFKQSIIWQINTQDAYDGVELGSRLYSEIGYGNMSIRNLCPVKGGSRPSGPDVFLLSNRNFDNSNDTVFVFHITGLYNDPETELKADKVIMDVPYGVPPMARQSHNRIFDTNDGRILDALIENGNIQFVANTLDPETGLAGVYHGFINNVYNNKTTKGHIIGDINLDFGYPAIAYTGEEPHHNDVIIVFNHTSDTVFAGCSAIYYQDGEYSEIIRLKEGETRVQLLSDFYDRWGDYSGAQRAYNNPGNVWVSASWGKITGQGITLRRVNGTWITQLQRADIERKDPEDEIEVVEKIRAFPVPAIERFSIEFNVPTAEYARISLYDIKGNLISILISDKIREGNNIFSFSTAPLESGHYLIVINRADGSLITERMVVKK